EFVEGIGKLNGNTLGDHRRKTLRLASRMPKATGLAGIIEGSQRKWEEGLEGRRWLRVAEGAGVRGLRRYEASVPGSSLRLLLTMPSYFIVASMVLATRDLAERVISGINPRDLAEMVVSGINLGDLAERVISGANLGDLAEGPISGTNPGDLAERVVSGINLGDLAKGILASDPEASPSGASSRPPSLVDSRALQDLEVMKVDHDLDTTVTEGSLAMIREQAVQHPGRIQVACSATWAAPLQFGRAQYVHLDRMDLDELRGMPKVSGGKAPSTHAAVPAREVNDPARRPKKVKVLTRRHKSRHGDGESRSRSKSKELAAPSVELETPAESDKGGASPVHHRLRSMKDLFKTKVHKDDAGYYTLHMSDLASELEQEFGKTKQERDEVLQQLEAFEKELTEVRSNLAEIQRLLKEARVKARKMDDELLQSVKALESARVELPKQAIDRYKESTGFKEGLKRMGWVTYEYGYRVALARFHALHPDSEVEEDPFTIHPEDDLVLMKR
ncbi:hypothetical protein BHM03_00051796, partial [Ensete ventricosum]